MEPRSAQRSRSLSLLFLLVATTTLGPGGGRRASGGVGLKRPDPAQVVPLDQVAPHAREGVAEVIRDAHFHKLGKSETFPCNPRIYMKLLSEPALTLSLWQDVGPTPARLNQVAPGKYQGTDGAGTQATWEFVVKSPRLNVLLCNLDYTTPRGGAHLSGRIVMIVRSGYFREVNGDFWVQQEVEAFVKVDSRGWKAVAITVKPLIEKLLDDQVREAGWFVSMMGRLVETYPEWASTVAKAQKDLPVASRDGFIDVVKQTRRPGASTGRPVLADTGATRVK